MSRLSKTFMPPNSVNGCWLPTLISPICTSLSVTEFPLINEFYRINKWVAARLTGLFVVQGRLNITGEQRVAVSRCRGKFRVKLAGDKPGMTVQCHHPDQSAIRRPAPDTPARRLHLIHVVVVNFIAVTMSLDHGVLTANFSCFRVFHQTAFLHSQAHGAPQVRALNKLSAPTIRIDP